MFRVKLYFSTTVTWSLLPGSLFRLYLTNTVVISLMGDKEGRRHQRLSRLQLFLGFHLRGFRTLFLLFFVVFFFFFLVQLTQHLLPSHTDLEINYHGNSRHPSIHPSDSLPWWFCLIKTALDSWLCSWKTKVIIDAITRGSFTLDIELTENNTIFQHHSLVSAQTPYNWTLTVRIIVDQKHWSPPLGRFFFACPDLKDITSSW